MSRDLAIALVGVMLVIAQITLIAFKIMEKRAERKFLESLKDNDTDAYKKLAPKQNSTPAIMPGFAQICIDHGNKLVKFGEIIKNLVSQRAEDRDDEIEWKREVRSSFKSIFDKLDEK